MREGLDTHGVVFAQAAQAAQATTGLICTLVADSAVEHGRREHAGMVVVAFRACRLCQPYVVRRSLSAATIQLLTSWRRDSPAGLLVVATYVNERQANALRQGGVHFIDLSGNVFVAWDDLYVLVSGRRAVAPPVVEVRMRALHGAGIQLLFALLTDPWLDHEQSAHALVAKPYRDISAVTGIPRSSVGWIMTDLSRQGFVVQTEDGVRRLVERKRILERWVQAYAERFRPGLVRERYQPAHRDWWKTATLEQGFVWSGEVAAAKLTGALKPGTVTIFGARPSHAFVLKHDLQKDPAGTVEFIAPFWAQTAVMPGTGSCAHPLLVYADLLTIDDERTREVAQVLYDRYLRAIIEAA